MTAPVTTLSSIVLLAQQQYGVRFQLRQQQVVEFANMIQFIAFNQDFDAFREYQIFFLGQDTLLETDTTYTAPIAADIGKQVTGSVTTTIGKLMNFQTSNRVNKWIIEPPDGGPNFVLTDSEVLTIVGGSAATGVVCIGQSYDVSHGPYKVPGIADGNPPFRKLIGVTTVTDKQIFGIPPTSSFNGFDDFGLPLNSLPGRRMFFPYRMDLFKTNQEITLVSSTPPEITQTDEACGPSGTTLNTSKLRWVYYRNPATITDIDDEANLALPERYRYEILFSGITQLNDIATYGQVSPANFRLNIEPLCERFWEDMRTQYQAYGRDNDFISMGDTPADQYGSGLSSRFTRRGQSWV